MTEAVRALLAGRPPWMNAVFAFCLFMTFVYMPYDVFWKPVERDVEVWLGLSLHGRWAKATEPLHWAIYAAGAYGFWRMKRWLHPWAAVYVAQVAVGMLVWAGLAVLGGRSPLALLPGLLAFALFWTLAVLLWRSRDRFTG